MFIISDQDEQTIINALRAAAELYRQTGALAPELAKQFERQAQQAEDLAVRIEVGEG